MKKFLLLMVAVASLLTACNKDTNIEFIPVDYSADLVGTWSCLTPYYAESLVIKSDGTVLSTGVEDGELWKNIKGTIKAVNNKLTMIFQDGDNFEGRFEMIPGEAFSIFNEEGDRLTYRYCKHSVSNDILGVWVCNDSPDIAENDMAIATYKEDDRAFYTGIMPGDNVYGVNYEQDYTVVGNMMFRRIVKKVSTSSTKEKYVASLLTYTPNGTAYGDILTETIYMPIDDVGGVKESIFSWLRVKETLTLQEKKYSYSNLYISNVSGKDQDITFNDTTFNFAKMDGVKLDQMLKAILFNIEFPDNQTIKYGCNYNDFKLELEVPVIVDGNKMTMNMKSKSALYRNVDVFTFQDADDSQMHMYMSTEAFINFFGNMQLAIQIEKGTIDKNNPAAAEAVFASVDDVVDSINLSFIFKSVKK